MDTSMPRKIEDLATNEFWSPLLYTDGQLDPNKVAAELADYATAWWTLGRVIDECAEGMSGCYRMYTPDAIIGQINERYEKSKEQDEVELREEFKEELESQSSTIARLEAELERVTGERDGLREVVGDDGATRVVAHLRSDNAGLRTENHLLTKAAKHGVSGAPEGFEPIEAWTDGKQIVVLGSPPDEDNGDDPQHNCDAMGCSSVGPHVLAYFDHPYAALSARQNGEGVGDV
jgi:hypothetical protein